MNRRRFTSILVQSSVAPILLQGFKWNNMDSKVKRPRRVGTTFSQLQCNYLGIDYKEAFKQVCSMGFDVIRLGSYWNEIERVENEFDFQALDWLLNESQKHSIKVVLTVGMKAPRWPEYHFPDWLKARYDTTRQDQPLDANPAIAERTLKFIEAVVEHTKHARNIKYWQVENEPLTQLEVAAGRFISHDFVQQEVKLTRDLARRGQKILLTNAIGLPSANAEHDDRAFKASINLADAIGINVYTKVAISPDYYLQPETSYWQKLQEWQKQLKEAGKEHWIAEAQAEPWEYQKLVAMDKSEYPSTSPSQATDLVLKLNQVGYETVMLWGCEYWYWHMKNGRNAWVKAVEQLVEA
ncbi:MAG: beta-galactosidase [Aphanothece sp. CMT-3BRIN-NPC111]|jgi:hypothetical protein|nr:beta-galactosidase [Aphanothece sp. CMT-3BRIN-NPC111]